MEAAAEATTPKPEHATVEIPTEEPQAASTAAAAQNSNQQQPSSSLAATKSTSTPKTPPRTPSKSSLRKRFSAYNTGTDGLTFWMVFNLIELALSIVFLGLVVACLTVDSWKHNSIWDIGAWKWCLLLSVILGARQASGWIVNAATFTITGCVDLYVKLRKSGGDDESDSVWSIFSPREKFVYVAFGLRTSFQVFLWVASVLVAWSLLIGRTRNDHGRSRHAKRVIDHITRALAGCLVGAGIWWAKTLAMNLAAYSFIVERSRKRFVSSIDDQVALKSMWDNSRPLGSSQRVFGKASMVVKESDDFLLKDRVRMWTPPKLVDTLTRMQLTVVVDSQVKGSGPERVARDAANELFARIAGNYDAKYIDTDKVLATLKEEHRKLIPVNVEEGGVGQISRSYFKIWVVKIHMDRLLLLRTLNGRDNVVGDLNRVVSGTVLVIISVVWLLVMGFLTTQVMLLLATQIIALNFMFNNTAKTIFEAVIFVFVTRPFDVGDLCSIDEKDEQVVVHDMNILNTVFKKSNGQSLFYPNALLMGKCITNYYGVPETYDSVRFNIATNTKPDTIEDFKTKIKEYLKSRPKHWRSNDYMILVEDDIKRREKSVKIYVDHVVNYYNGGDRRKHRQELLDEVNGAINHLKIECYGNPL